MVEFRAGFRLAGSLDEGNGFMRSDWFRVDGWGLRVWVLRVQGFGTLVTLNL